MIGTKSSKGHTKAEIVHSPYGLFFIFILIEGEKKGGM